jgi:hypothetical protein
MRGFRFAIVLGFCAFIGGCQSGSSSRVPKEQLAVMKALQPQLMMYLKMLDEGRQNGIAEIRMRPGGGRLFIDGGEYLAEEQEIILPVGTYEFKAVWDDGREATRRIFLQPGMSGTATFNMNWQQTGGQLKWKISPDEIQIKKTPIDLVRPNR